MLTNGSCFDIDVDGLFVTEDLEWVKLSELNEKISKSKSFLFHTQRLTNELMNVKRIHMRMDSSVMSKPDEKQGY